MTAALIKARNPRTGAADYSFPRHDAVDVEHAAHRAREAQPAWAALGFDGRQAILTKFAVALNGQRANLQAALEEDTGRRRISGLEIDGVIASLSTWPRRAKQLRSPEWLPGVSAPHIRHAPRWFPYPLVGVISPWNFPLLLSMADAVPALTAGCSVIIKPSEINPRFVEPMQRAARACGELGDVLQILTGDAETGAAVVQNVDCICFTGSVGTGRQVAMQAAGRLIPAFLELGGKDPLLVLPGANLTHAVEAALRGSVLATGQACQSIERVYVHRSLYTRFVTDLVTRAQAVRLNWPDIASGDIGPIICERQAQILKQQLADALAKNAQILSGGTIEEHGGGLWLRPTVMIGVTHAMKVMTEETFGPIVPVMAFDTLEEGIALANFGAYGLSAGVFAGSLEAAESVASRLEVGAVSLNDAALTATFYEAGKQSFKASGLGPSRMGSQGLSRFFRRQALIANTAAPASLASFAEDIPGPDPLPVIPPSPR